MSQSVRLRVSLAVEYDADPDDYGTDIPEEMAAIDEANYRTYPGNVFTDYLNEDNIAIKVTLAEAL